MHQDLLDRYRRMNGEEADKFDTESLKNIAIDFHRLARANSWFSQHGLVHDPDDDGELKINEWGGEIRGSMSRSTTGCRNTACSTIPSRGKSTRYAAPTSRSVPPSSPIRATTRTATSGAAASFRTTDSSPVISLFFSRVQRTDRFWG